MQLQRAKTTTFLQGEGLFEVSTGSLVIQLHAREKWQRWGNHNCQKIRLGCIQVAVDRNRSMASQRVNLLAPLSVFISLSQLISFRASLSFLQLPFFASPIVLSPAFLQTSRSLLHRFPLAFFSSIFIYFNPLSASPVILRLPLDFKTPSCLLWSVKACPAILDQ